MTAPLGERYRAYLDCLTAQDLHRLGGFVRDDVRHNGNALGLEGYRALLREDRRLIPDLRYMIELLVVDEDHVAARLVFDCTPVGEFLGLPVNGRRVTFHENVIYTYVDSLIADVRSVIDTVAIAAQLSAGPRAG